MDSESGNGFESDENSNSKDNGKAILFTTTRHRCKLQEDGYFYVFDKMSTNGQKKFWRCEKKSTCNARIHTDAITNEIVKRATQHNHPSSLVRSSVQRKILKRQSDELFTNEEISTKQRTPSVESLLQEIMKASGFNSNQTEETLTNLKKEYGDIISQCCLHSLSPEGMINYRKLINLETAEVSTTNKIEKSFLRTNTKSISEQQISTSSGMEQLAEAEESDGFQLLLRLTSGSFTFYGNEINKIIDDGTQFCAMASNSNLSKSFSLLIKGAEKTGKSCLATLIAKNSGIPSIKVCLPENMLKLNEEAKKIKLIDLFEEAIKLPQCILFLDGLELLIEYCDVGDRYSSIILQTIKLILKKGEILENNRLLVIATVTTECAEKFGLQRYFSSVIKVPVLTKTERIISIIEYANILNKADYQILREYLMNDTNSYKVGIKSLLTTIELVKHSTTTNRLHTLLQHLLQWKQ
ncbi:Vesicle-fusing ATPase [Dirofilaria immitis]